MAQKVIFKVFGHGILNGNYKIDIEKEMDADLAYRLRSKNNLIQFVKQECPGVEIKENSLGYRINPIKSTPQENSNNKSNRSTNSSKPTKKTKLSEKGTVVGAVVGAIANEMKETEEDKAERLKQEKYIDDLGKSVSEKISQIEQLKVPNEKDGIVDMLDDLIYKLKSNKWKPIIGAKSEDEAKLINSLMGAYFLKYSMGLQKLERMNLPDDILIPYQLELKKLKKRRFLGKFSYILLLLGIAAVIAILYQFGVFKD
jgi:hypothetical protein